MKDCTTCKYGYEEERLGISMCHHPKRFSEDCIDFNMHEEKESEHLADARKTSPNDLEEAAEEYVSTLCDRLDEGLRIDTTLESAFKAGAKWQREQMMKEDYPKWRRIKAGERLPCPAYVWTIAYDNYPDCFEGRLMPNIQGVKVGRDTWYLPVDVIHNLPKED